MYQSSRLAVVCENVKSEMVPLNGGGKLFLHSSPCPPLQASTPEGLKGTKGYLESSVGMAFFTKAGNILRQAVSKQHINHEISASKPSIFQLIRCMSSSKLFVGGISWNTNDDALKQAFSKYGDVVEARVIVDRETGRSRGFGFVTFNSSEDASAAIQALDQQELDGRRIRVNIANDRTRGYGGGGGGFGAGGYGGGGNYGSSGYGGGGNYGATGYGGSGNYGSGGGGDANVAGSYGANNYGSGESSFGFGTSGGNNFPSGDSYASENQNLGADAAGSGDTYGTGDAASNSFTSNFGSGDTYGTGDAASNSFTSNFGSSDQFGNDDTSNQAETADVNSPVDAGADYRDDNESSDYANRRA